MATLKPNDPIYSQPGYWIDNRGTEMPIVARYSVWVISALLFLPFLVVFRVIGLGWVLAVAAAAGASGWIATLASDHLNGEHTVQSWAMTAWGMARSALHRDRRRRRPIRYRSPLR